MPDADALHLDDMGCIWLVSGDEDDRMRRLGPASDRLYDMVDERHWGELTRLLAEAEDGARFARACRDEAWDTYERSRI